jgi:hypothetical protein
VPFWRKPLVWLGGLVTVVLGGVLVSVLSNEAQRFVPPPAPATSTASSDHAGPPLMVVSERPLNVDEFAYWAFPDRLALSARKLAYVNSLFLHDGPTSLPVAHYFSSLGGYAIHSIETLVVVQNNRSYPIRIIDMHVIKSCRAPVTGTIFYAPGGAEDTIIGLGFDLDSADTGARIVRGMRGIQTADYFDKYTISIGPGAQQVFRFQASTSRYACTFRYQATILDGKKQVYQLIGNGRQPFRVSTAPAVPPTDLLLAGYSVGYVAGPISPAHNGAFVRVDPKTFH